MNIPKQLFFIPLLFLVQTLYGQKRSSVRPSVPPPPPPKSVSGDVCAKNANLSFATRIKKYPFNGSTQVQLIAFEGRVAISSDGEFMINHAKIDLRDVNDTTGSVGLKESKAPTLVESDILMGSDETTGSIGLKENRSLTLPQIDTLTGILYNYGVPRFPAGVKIITTKSESGCYTPRNAILFRDSNGKALAFVEICFECTGTRLSDKRISLGEMCSEKLDMIRDFFRKAGIRYGI